MGVLLEGGAGEAEIAGFLVALKMKGETAAELANDAARCPIHNLSPATCAALSRLADAG